MNISDYTYHLPPEKIANYPLPHRDAAKLLVYDRGKITHAHFRSVADFLPAKSFLFFNNTKVIPARLKFAKDSGASIEVFLLHPLSPSTLLAETMASAGGCRWQCAIGNLKRWKEGTSLRKDVGGIVLTATLHDRNGGAVDFSWRDDVSFAEIVRKAGETPLPPYIRRRAEADDTERYQTIYSRHDGAVAAPTAGLHFTDDVFARLKEKDVGHDFVTLHVSAGTFQPVKVENAEEHVMHAEQVVVSRENIANLLAPDRIIVAVGTTSMRTLESLYWFGVKLLQDPSTSFRVGQRDPYIAKNTPGPRIALKAVLDYMERNNLRHLTGETAIFIRPGYSFKVCRGLITNFHQPGSTLILLVAAFVGDAWKEIYSEALARDYRFLSYGDSSLLVPAPGLDAETPA